jgi:signal transduction histidine kinase
VVSALDLGEALEAERDRVVAATRTERDRLRRDLHDGLGPSLSGVGLGLQALESALAAGDDATATELLARVRAEARTAVADVRRILDDLRPVALDEAGFADAIRRYTSAFPTSLSIDVDVPESLKGLPPQVETVAYRIAQEGLTNVVRHAGATHARLRVAAVDHSLRVEVADDGQGFGRAQSAGVGLGSMRHRAESVGGTLAVSTGDGGTTVVASLPLGGLA